jgi:hypothetical protein
MINRDALYDLETLLHAILNCGLETCNMLKENNTEYDGNIVDEVERLYELVKEDNKMYEDLT